MRFGIRKPSLPKSVSARTSLNRILRSQRGLRAPRRWGWHVGIHSSHASIKDAHAPVFYLHLEPDNWFAVAGIWHPDNQALTKARLAIVREPERWAKVRSDSLLKATA